MTPSTRREDNFVLVCVFSSPLIGYRFTLYTYKRRIVYAERIASLRPFTKFAASRYQRADLVT
jgi:hypothetical protein